MRKFLYLLTILGVLCLVALVTAYAGGTTWTNVTGKETPKQTVVPVGKSTAQQPAQVAGHGEDPAKCAEKHATGQCQGHPPGSCPGCDPAKCAEKHATGQCQGHPPGQCQKTAQGAPSKK